MTRAGFCLDCGRDFALPRDAASDVPVPGFCAEHADGEHARTLAETCDRIIRDFAPRSEAVVLGYVGAPDGEGWARIHRHRFAEWRPGSKCRECGRDAGHAVHGAVK